MSELPPGWEWATLGEIGAYLNGRGFKKSEWSHTGRPIIRIQNLTGSGAAFNYFQGQAEDRHTVRDGDLLVSWAATLGVYVWRGPEAVLNQHIFKVESSVNRRFHRWLLDHVLADLHLQTHGSGMVHITKGRFDATEVPLPPRAEQERIVAAIEEHLSRLDAADTALSAAGRRLRVFEQRCVDEATEGQPVPLGTLLSEPLRNGLSAKASPLGSVRVVTLTAVTRSEFTEANTKLIDPDRRPVDDLWMTPGDVFIERSNTPELVGTSAMYDGPRHWAIFPDLLIRARPDPARLVPAYLELALRSTAIRRYFQRSAQGIAGSMPKVSQGTVEAVEIPLPSLDGQWSIVDRFRGRAAVAERLAAEVGRSVERARVLRRSILAAAFSGKLVPQDPDDEPASVLLARIRAERVAAAPKTRTRRVKVP